MKHFIEFSLGDDGAVLVEVDEQHEARQRASRGEDGIEKAQHSFSEALARIRPAAEAVLQTFRELNTPDEIALEFGIKFTARAGAIIASVDSEATFKVAIKWTNKT